MESIPLLVTLLHYDVNYIQGYICALVSGFPICERTGEQSKWSEQEGSKQSERACEERWRTNKWANEWPLWKTPFRVSQVIVDWCTNRNNAYTEKKKLGALSQLIHIGSSWIINGRFLAWSCWERGCWKKYPGQKLTIYYPTSSNVYKLGKGTKIVFFNVIELCTASWHALFLLCATQLISHFVSWSISLLVGQSVHLSVTHLLFWAFWAPAHTKVHHFWANLDEIYKLLKAF